MIGRQRQDNVDQSAALTAAMQSAADARAQLACVQERDVEVRRVVAELRELRTRNHFARSLRTLLVERSTS